MVEKQLDIFFRQIQSFFNPNTVLIVGSGLSCAEGISGMGNLAKELLKKVPSQIKNDSQDLWYKIKGDLIDENSIIRDDVNLEATLLKFSPNEDIENIIRNITTDLIKREEQQVIQKVVKGERNLKFSNFIKRFSLSENGLTIITTNYDRLIEIACEIEGIPVDNLFYGKNISVLNESKSKMSFCEKIINHGKSIKLSLAKKIVIYKPHGCLSWYLYNGNPIHSNFDLNLDRLVVTPGGNKYKLGYNTPFDIHRTKANSAISNASKFIIIGYGFNDDHLETYLKQRIISGIPTLILTRSLSQNTRNIIKGKENVISISYFKEDVNSGSEVFFDNTIYKIPDKHWWDIENLIEGVFGYE
ncbi:SIR2 family protein [Alkaliphilus sp. B6464]|uniref:SIR2 family protein n=1 Tax=Alkaliphilus sp. B6464 TaxID=2731219 RepID=UPI001BA7DFE5|nr:SIR2 family protein [Alkaliphilus sp. B6464]QUH20410.1 SIR2 family protein [Alkaliphilus sp. B6464]